MTLANYDLKRNSVYMIYYLIKEIDFGSWAWTFYLPTHWDKYVSIGRSYVKAAMSLSILSDLNYEGNNLSLWWLI